MCEKFTPSFLPVTKHRVLTFHTVILSVIKINTQEIEVMFNLAFLRAEKIVYMKFVEHKKILT